MLGCVTASLYSLASSSRISDIFHLLPSNVLSATLTTHALQLATLNIFACYTQPSILSASITFDFSAVGLVAKYEPSSPVTASYHTTNPNLPNNLRHALLPVFFRFFRFLDILRLCRNTSDLR